MRLWPLGKGTKYQSLSRIRKAFCLHKNIDSMSEPKCSKASIHARKEIVMAYGRLVTYKGIDQRSNTVHIIGARFLTVGGVTDMEKEKK